MMIEEAREVLMELLNGNERFRTGRSKNYLYHPPMLADLAEKQEPIAAIVSCADSRVAPDIVFDQPLGKIFAARVPGNVASDTVQWMLDIAIPVFNVPLVMVLGHTGCLAVGQMLEGDRGGAGGAYRLAVLNAVYRARAQRPDDLFRAAVAENVRQTVEHLQRDSQPLRKALEAGETSIIGAVYDMTTGEVEVLR